MISLGNVKLGPIPNWSIPAGETCPGQTSLCAGRCYVKNYTRVYKSAAVAYSRNNDSVLLTDWTVEIMRFLSRRKPSAFRIHVSGDFFSRSYIAGWEKTVRLFPETRFLAYTRSWRVPRLRRALETLRALPNVQIFASCDPEAHGAPAGWRRAWMGSPTDDSRTTLCPGYGPKELTCAECKLCFRASRVNVHFPIH